MKKISIFVLLSVIINLFSSFTAYATETNRETLKFINERISFIADEIDMSMDV